MIKIINNINSKFDDVIVIQGDLLKMIDDTEEFLYKILPAKYPVNPIYEAIKNAVLYRDYTIYNKEIEILLNHNNISVISPGVLENGGKTNSHNYIRRNMWIYEKLITLDDEGRFLKSGRGFTIMKKTFGKHDKVLFINSLKNNCFKVVFPSVSKFQNIEKIF